METVFVLTLYIFANAYTPPLATMDQYFINSPENCARQQERMAQGNVREYNGMPVVFAGKLCIPANDLDMDWLSQWLAVTRAQEANGNR